MLTTFNAKAAKHAKKNTTLASVAGFALDRVRLLHGRADQIAPLRPGSVVVLHVREAKQVLHREPRQAGALADAAVGDDRPVAGNSLRGVQRLQVVVALEGPVVVAVLAPTRVM